MHRISAWGLHTNSEALLYTYVEHRERSYNSKGGFGAEKGPNDRPTLQLRNVISFHLCVTPNVVYKCLLDSRRGKCVFLLWVCCIESSWIGRISYLRKP